MIKAIYGSFYMEPCVLLKRLSDGKFNAVVPTAPIAEEWSEVDLQEGHEAMRIMLWKNENE
jgi:hypothetical protein